MNTPLTLQQCEAITRWLHESGVDDQGHGFVDAWPGDTYVIVDAQLSADQLRALADFMDPPR